MGKSREDRDIHIVDSMTLSSPIPESEERKLVAAIDEAVNNASSTGQEPRMQAMARGSVFPLVAASLVMVTAAVVALFSARSITSGEATIISETQTYFTADEMIIAQVRRDSERKLELKDKEIAEIKDQLLELQRQRDTLNQSLAQSLREKETELRLEMEAAIEREKSRLQSENTSDSEVKRQIADLTTSQEASFALVLTEYASEIDLRTALRESELEAERARVENELIEAESEKARLIKEGQPVRNAILEAAESPDQGTAVLEMQLQTESLIANRILTLYTAIAASVDGSDFSRASTFASELLDFLKSDEYPLTPSLEARGDSELFIATALLDYFGMMESASASSGDIEDLPATSDESDYLKALRADASISKSRKERIEELEQALAAATATDDSMVLLLSELSTEKASLEQIIEDLRSKIADLGPYVSAASDGEVLRETVSAQRRRLGDRLAELPKSGPPRSMELLETKLLVVDILNSTEIAEKHPDLSSRLNLYLRALVQDEHVGGRISSLADISMVLDNLLDGESDPLSPLVGLSDKAQLAYVVDVLATLEMLLSQGLPK